MSNLQKTAKISFDNNYIHPRSKVLGLIREILIAAKFGSGIETDTFFVL